MKENERLKQTIAANRDTEVVLVRPDKVDRLIIALLLLVSSIGLVANHLAIRENRSTLTTVCRGKG